MLKIIIWLCVSGVVCCACSKNSGPVGPNRMTAQSSSSTAPAQNAAGELRYKVPSGWTAEKPTSDMRVAQYKLPKAEGDGEDALLIVYYFGQGQGGSAQANID